MIETPNSNIDVDQLMAEIRAEITREREPSKAGQAASASLPGSVRSGSPADGPHWFRIFDELNVAEQHSAIGTEIPAFSRLGPLMRRIARLTTRAVFYVLQVVTVHQRSYNIATIFALRQLSERVRELESELQTLRESTAREKGASRE